MPYLWLKDCHVAALLAMTQNRGVFVWKRMFCAICGHFLRSVAALRLSNVSFRKSFRFSAKPTDHVIARRAFSMPDAAILKLKAWHPGTKHGGAGNDQIQKFNLSRRDTTSALLKKRHFTRAFARISHASAYFTCSKSKFHCAAFPDTLKSSASWSNRRAFYGQNECHSAAGTQKAAV